MPTSTNGFNSSGIRVTHNIDSIYLLLKWVALRARKSQRCRPRNNLKRHSTNNQPSTLVPRYSNLKNKILQLLNIIKTFLKCLPTLLLKGFPIREVVVMKRLKAPRMKSKVVCSNFSEE
jgi:hypothetical protein